MAETGWRRPFDDEIVLPEGRIPSEVPGTHINFFEHFGGSRVSAELPSNLKPPIPKEVLMRILAFAILAIGTVSTGPAAAQMYDPAFPVCLHVWDRGANYYECRYTSLPQCNLAASGRAAGCVINPYFAGARVPAGGHYRRVY
jgi:hypothetical protein